MQNWPVRRKGVQRVSTFTRVTVSQQGSSLALSRTVSAIGGHQCHAAFSRSPGSHGRRDDPAVDERAKGARRDRHGLPPQDRRPDAVPIGSDRWRLPWLDVAAEIVRRAGLQRPDLDIGRLATADVPVRGRQRAATPNAALVPPEGMGHPAGSDQTSDRTLTPARIATRR
jgi:hypothetical protein